MLAPSFDNAVYQTMAPGVERAIRTREIAPATPCKTKLLADGLSPSHLDHLGRAGGVRGRPFAHHSMPNCSPPVSPKGF
jgi:hypothetical protein